ncbi:MAG: DUF6616 family protein [Melioribacteraceae bacterium]
MKVFIEFWKAKDAWHQLSKEERANYLGQIAPAMQELITKGAVFDAWGVNDDKTPQRADYDFYAVTKLPTQELLDSFQAIVEGSGWYNYFEQINLTGDNIGAEAVIGKMIEL